MIVSLVANPIFSLFKSLEPKGKLSKA